MRVDGRDVEPTFLAGGAPARPRPPPSDAEIPHLMKPLLRWAFPGGVVAALTAFLLTSERASGEGWVLLLTERYAPLAYLLGAGLAVAFHRSRVLALVLCVAAVEAAFAVAWASAEHRPAMAVGLLVALGMGALLRDRGITSPVGVVQLALAVGGTAGWVVAWRSAPEWLDVLLADPDTAGVWARATGLAPAAVWPVALSALFVAFAMHRWRGAAERGIAWAWLLVAATLPAWPGTGPDGSLLRMAAALVLGLAVLETSYAMAYRDELTGLPARRSLMRDLEGAGGTYTLAMVDVDHFKKFNDRHGHDVGDQVLRLVATRLDRAPGGARAYRYGGEEFTLLFRGLDRSEAEPHLEAVRASVEGAGFSLRRWTRPARGTKGKGRRAPAAARTLSVTVSIGVADSRSVPEGGAAGVLKKADQALYRAKRAGRNRVAR